MKKLFILLGFLTVAAIAFPSDPVEVKETFKTEFNEIMAPLNVDALRYDIIAEVNFYREAETKPALRADYLLTDGAQAWADKLPEDFIHDSYQITGKFDGEAILFYEGKFDPVRVALEFMQSRQHQDLLMDKNFSRVGVGIRRAGNVNYVVVRLE